MTYSEHALVFNCAGNRLVGIAAVPETPAETAVIIVVGGPQYRAGSHRQFTLLARQLAGLGIATLRFDYRGMGDSEGEMCNFEMVDADIRAAVDILIQHVPGVAHIVLWGLCDGASAAIYYAYTDARISGLILLNPWVHTEYGASRARLRHYYLARLMQRSFWSKLLSGKVMLSSSLGELSRSASGTVEPDSAVDARYGSPGYIDRMYEGLNLFKGKILIILSGNDLTAQEFLALTRQDKRWKKLVRRPGVSSATLKLANHTFSTRAWRETVGDWSATWISNLTDKARPDEN
ncbi:MAG: hydrolase 1, exosortase A system-associated [Pseudomonadota bacterium]